jgi:hypothetical protein
MALAWHVLVCAVAHGTLADKLLRRLIGEDIDLLSDLPPQLSRVWVDAASIEQVVMNLVVNVRDAIPHGGRLSIHTGEIEIGTPLAGAPPGIKPGRYVTVAVQDTGVAWDEEFRNTCLSRSLRLRQPAKARDWGSAWSMGSSSRMEGTSGF